MSSKLTMKDVMTANCQISNAEMLTSNHCAALARELNAILAAPVVQRQPDAWRYAISGMWEWCADRDHAVRELASFHAGDSADELAELEAEGLHVPQALYVAPPELAELQATIARLTAENERLKEVTNFKDAVACVFDHIKVAAANTGDKDWDERLEDLAEDIIECAPDYKKQWKDIGKLCAEIERLKGGQGEPVAWQYMTHPTWDKEPWPTKWDDCTKEAHDDYVRAPLVADWEYRTRKLYASQPAPVSSELVQLLERAKVYARGPFLDEINACLDKVKELNQ